ncbi:hypothetical protein [Arcobacter sp.]|uniref:hypothetical protein n=1 Tax=unclassified Arcobacter TaxID=2593671 RepID=UPI003B00CEB6
MNKNISNNISNIVLTAYKNAQNGKTLDVNNIIKSSIISVGINILKNEFTGQTKRTSKIEKTVFIGGLLLLGLNYVGNKQTLNY